jgi:hypothetical protein
MQAPPGLLALMSGNAGSLHWFGPYPFCAQWSGEREDPHVRRYSPDRTGASI